MSRESTIRDLRAKAKQLEESKREIDKQVEAIYVTLRIFEQTADVVSGASIPSTYAQELTNGMYDVLLAERPLHRRIICDRLGERGIHVGGKTPINTISSYLSTDGRFKNVGKGLWTLAEEPSSAWPSLEEDEEEADETYLNHNNGHPQGRHDFIPVR